MRKSRHYNEIIVPVSRITILSDGVTRVTLRYPSLCSATVGDPFSHSSDWDGQNLRTDDSFLLAKTRDFKISTPGICQAKNGSRPLKADSRRQEKDDCEEESGDRIMALQN